MPPASRLGLNLQKPAAGPWAQRLAGSVRRRRFRTADRTRERRSAVPPRPPTSWRPPCGPEPCGRRRALDRALGALLGEQFDGLFPGELLERGAARHGDVGDAVGDVRAEAAFLHHDVLLRDRVRAELGQRRHGGTGAALLGLRVDLQRLLQRDGEDFLLGADRAGVRALLQVRAEPAVLHRDRVALGVLARARGAGSSAAAPRPG